MMNDEIQKNTEHCPMCDSGDVKDMYKFVSLHDRQGDEFDIDKYEYTFCQECGTEFVTAKQGRSNEQQLENARRVAADLLTTDQVRKIRKKYNLRQEDASCIFGGGPNAFSKYERGYISQSMSMDRLLRVADHFPQTIPFLASLAGKSVVVSKTTLIGVLDEVQISVGHVPLLSHQKIHSKFARYFGGMGNMIYGKSQLQRSVRTLRDDSSNDDNWVDEPLAEHG